MNNQSKDRLLYDAELGKEGNESRLSKLRTRPFSCTRLMTPGVVSRSFPLGLSQDILLEIGVFFLHCLIAIRMVKKQIVQFVSIKLRCTRRGGDRK